MRMRSALIVGMAGAVLALSGCGGDDDTPSTLPSATGGASESGSATDGETPSATPTADPTAALQAELEAFFRRYTDVFNASFNSTAAAEERRSFYSTSCSICIAGQQLVDGFLSRDYVTEGATADLHSVRIDSTDNGNVVVTVVMDFAAGTVTSQGSVVQEFPADPDFAVVYTLRKQPSGEWLIIQGEALG